MVGNYVGTDSTGNHSVGNYTFGLFIGQDANSNTIGGTTASARNVISGNVAGVVISNASGELVEGNWIGTNAAGTSALPNAGGVEIVVGAQVTIGGSAAGAGNVISGNTGIGLSVETSPGVLVAGNRIGTNAAGTAAIPNTTDGVDVISSNDTIGGTASGAGNVISGNGVEGINLNTSYSTGVVVEGNKIGTDVTGKLALGNGYDGVLIQGEASYNTIGGTTVAARNVISGNFRDGVQIDNAGTTWNAVEGNAIGVGVALSKALANHRDGVYLWDNTSFNIIGGAGTAAGNIISGNLENGVIIDDGSTENSIQNDYIGTDGTSAIAVPNGQNGVLIQAGSTLNAVSFDVISGNDGDGVLITGTGTAYNSVTFDLIGLNAAGTAIVKQAGEAFSNDGVGVEIASGAIGAVVSNCVIGGNVIGVEIDFASDSTVIDSEIGTGASGTRNFGNLDYGIALNQTSGDTVEYNVVAHSGVYGILIIYSTDNTLQYNVFIANTDGDVVTFG